MSEYWLISAPADKTRDETWKTMQKLTSKHKMAEIFKFPIPDLIVGTLDQLFALSEDLEKLDDFVGNIIQNLASYFGEIIEDKDKISDHFRAGEKDLASYLIEFSWDEQKYPVKQPLKTIYEIIEKKASQIDEEFIKRSTEFKNLKSSLRNEQKKQALFNNWKSSYEKMAEMVVPRSSHLISKDCEYGLFTVTLFKAYVADFKRSAEKMKFNVREYYFDEGLVGKMEKLEMNKYKITMLDIKWLKVNFSESFCAWIHVKALRVFVESVLRYGLPAIFQAAILHPQKKTMKPLRKTLNEHYAHLDMSYMQYGKSNRCEFFVPGLDMSKTEYYPYVDFKINIDLLGGKKFKK